jgi:hypothetical protein
MRKRGTIRIGIVGCRTIGSRVARAIEVGKIPAVPARLHNRFQARSGGGLAAFTEPSFRLNPRESASHVCT